jgi:hypothetical protein
MRALLSLATVAHSQHPAFMHSRNSVEIFERVRAACRARNFHFTFQDAQQSTFEVLLRYANNPPARVNDSFAMIWSELDGASQLWIAQGLAERHFYGEQRWS